MMLKPLTGQLEIYLNQLSESDIDEFLMTLQNYIDYVEFGVDLSNED